MTNTLVHYDVLLDTLFDAHLLCQVCDTRPWTQRARWCHALICGDCAQGEPPPEEP